MAESVRQASPSSQAPFPDPIPTIIRFGSVNLWSGASGVGKTIMLAEWFARMREGRTIWHKQTNCPTEFCVIAADRDWSTYAEAFRDAGFPDAELKRYVLADSTDENPQGWHKDGALSHFLFCLEKLDPQPGALVLTDPLSPLFIKGDQNRALDCAVSLHWIRRCGRQRQITQILSSNTIKISADPKEGYKRSRDNISGSGALVAYSDTSIYTEPPVDWGEPTTIGWAPRRAPEETFQCQFDPKTRLFIPYAGVTDEGDTSETDRPSLILTVLPETTGLRKKDWYHAAHAFLSEQGYVHYEERTFERDIVALLQRALITRVAQGQYARRKLQ